MKVVWLLPNLHITGGSRHALALLAGLVRRGHTAVAAVPSGRVHIPIPSGVEVIEFGPEVESPILTIPAASIAMAFDLPAADVIIGSMPPYAILANCISYLRGGIAVNYVMTDEVHLFDDRSLLRSSIALSAYRTLARIASRNAVSLANSHWTATKIVAAGGKPPAAIIPAGIDQSVFWPQPLPRQQGVFRIATVGRRIRNKGLAEVLEALTFLHNDGLEFKLSVISREDLQLPKLPFQYTRLAPSDDIELGAAFRQADLFVHATWFEGFGMPPLEALASGVPVVCTNSGGVREYLRDGVNCRLVPPQEPRTLARAIRELYENTALCESLRLEGLATAKHFYWDDISDRFEQALVSILQEKA